MFFCNICNILDQEIVQRYIFTQEQWRQKKLMRCAFTRLWINDIAWIYSVNVGQYRRVNEETSRTCKNRYLTSSTELQKNRRCHSSHSPFGRWEYFDALFLYRTIGKMWVFSSNACGLVESFRRMQRWSWPCQSAAMTETGKSCPFTDVEQRCCGSEKHQYQNEYSIK